MEQQSVYYLSQKGQARGKKMNIITMVGLYGLIVIFLLYRILSTPFTWDKDLVNIVWIAFCICSAVYWYNKTSKQLKGTRLQITDTGVTLFTPLRTDLHIDFANVKLVNKTDLGLVLAPNANGKKVVMITNKFESYEEIEDKIDKATTHSV